MKKILCLILACFTAFCFAACSKDEDDAKESVKYTYDVDDNFVGEYIFKYFKNNLDPTTTAILNSTEPLDGNGTFEKFYFGGYPELSSKLTSKALHSYGVLTISTDIDIYAAAFPKELKNLDGNIYYCSSHNDIVDYIDFSFEIEDEEQLEKFYTETIAFFDKELPDSEMNTVSQKFSYIYLDDTHWISFSKYVSDNMVSVSIHTDKE